MQCCYASGRTLDHCDTVFQVIKQIPWGTIADRLRTRRYVPHSQPVSPRGAIMWSNSNIMLLITDRFLWSHSSTHKCVPSIA